MHRLMPVLMGFFIMAFSDMVAPVSGVIAAECAPEQHALVSWLPTMAFVWFLVLAVPMAALMSRRGRCWTARVGYLLTMMGLLIPFFAGRGCDLVWYFVGFGLLGWGNLALQASLNPMLALMAPVDRMTRYMTLGQLFRNTALMLFAPLLLLSEQLLGDWRPLLALYALLALVAYLWMGRGEATSEAMTHPLSLGECVALLSRRGVRIGVAGVALFLMADVACGFLSSRMIPDGESLLTTTGYYACRIVGSLLAVWVLKYCSDKRFLRWNLLPAMVAAIGLMICTEEVVIYLLFALIGFTFATPFATFYAVAMQDAGEHEHAVAGLLVMAISAGALSGPICDMVIRLTGEVQMAAGYVLCTLLAMWVLARLADGRGGMKKSRIGLCK